MLTFRSPAKVNLFLKITGRRENGYHELVSFIQTISLFDTLTFEPSERDFFSCTDPSLQTDDSNLVIKALKLFREKTNWNVPLNIHLTKKIPLEAGLGGGSSNAATTLYALNVLAGMPFKEKDLQEMGLLLGSDVPLFFSSGSVLVSGTGDIVTDQPEFAQPGPFSIFKPNFGLSSRDVYQKFREIGKIIALEDQVSIEKLIERYMYMNDLEKSAFRLRPDLLYLKLALEESGFDRVVMTGSGTAFFCLGEGDPPPFEGFRMVYMQPLKRNKSGWY